jgi:hypothetical protein
MDARELRLKFRDFAGPDRYRKFVRSINRACRCKRRLLFWQERLWDEFLTETPVARSSGDIFAAFGACDVHDCILHEPHIDDGLPVIRDTPDADDAIENAFPFARDGDRICSDCRIAYVRWVREHDDLCRILRCRTTYEAFCTRRFGEDIVQSLFPKIQERSREIAAQMEPGDEMWEWDCGGWHRFSGTAGIAVVRAGQIVQQWCEVRS